MVSVRCILQKSVNQSCYVCQKRHHTLLHTQSADSPAGKKREKTDAAKQDSEKPKVFNTMIKPSVHSERTVLLATAVVRTFTSNGYPVSLRLLLDSCSQSCLITKKCARSLGLRVSFLSTSVRGLGLRSQSVLAKTTFEFFFSWDKNKKFNVSAMVIERITEKLQFQR